MNGWRVSETFERGFKVYNYLSKVNNSIAKLRRKQEQKRIQQLLKAFTGMEKSELGIDEANLFNFSRENGFIQYVTTESIVFHFAFGPTEDFLMNRVFLDIKF